MKTKVLVLLAALSFGAPIFISPDAYAHGGSKSYCPGDGMGNTYGCKHNKQEKKRNNSKCHTHDYDGPNGGWKKFDGIMGMNGSNCKKT